jgi:hypothetical protein
MLLFASFVPLLCGCGTVMNMERCDSLILGAPLVKEARPFGGVAEDVRGLGEMMSAVGGLADFNPMAMIGFCCICVDVPLSAVGDVVTLPEVLRRRAEERRSAPPEALRTDPGPPSVPDDPVTRARP